MKRRILVLVLVTNAFALGAQVNMPQGTMSFAIPIYTYFDNLSKLSFKTELLYNSGQGLEIDQVSNSVGTKWNLSGIPVVTRTIRGLPDDQLEKAGDVFDVTKYPAGYLYNSNSISLGCPTALAKYPIFTGQGNWVDNSNLTQADRELDEFQFSLNGSAGSFVIDKNFNAIQLNDTRTKIEIFTENQTVTKNIRTSIKEFDITDVDGIKYIFSEQETNKVFKVSEHDPNGSWDPGAVFSKCYDIALTDNPFITSTWYVTKIIDTKTNRFILFSYNTEVNKYQVRGQLQTELSNQQPVGPFYGSGLNTISGTTADNQAYSVYAYNTKGTIIKKDIQKKVINSITFPDASYISFSYLNERKDLEDTKMLDNISIFGKSQTLLLKYDLTHSYFIKNEIRDPVTTEENKWARLCLKEIKKIGSSADITENPWKFDYYTGTNSTENFVPPYFFHARDPWGYYNGNYSGVSTTNILDDHDKVSWTKVCIYNQPHGYPGGIDIFYNSKSGYAKNGLLKSVINPFGGITEYQYEQNYSKQTSANYFLSYDHNSAGESVGGVHVSKVIEKPDNIPANELTTEYIYTGDDGYSTLWGQEALKFNITQRSFWQAEDQYFNGTECRYHYLYPGRTFSTSNAGDDFKLFLGLAKQGYGLYKQSNYARSIAKTYAKISKMPSELRKAYQYQLNISMVNAGLNLLLEYAIGVIVSCSNTPQRLNTRILTHQNSVNTNLLPSLYKKVAQKKYSAAGLQAGKTVYEFTSPDDFPLILPNESASFEQKVRAYEWMYGLPKSAKYYDNASGLLKSTESEYELKKVDVISLNTQSCNCETYWQQSLRSDQWNTSATFNEFTNVNTNNSYGVKQKVDFYNIVTGHNELKKSTEKTYNQSGSYIVSSTDYLYNPVNNLVASQISTNSKGNTIETKNYYIEDYNLNNPSNSILSQMKNDNILDVAVSSETWQTKTGGTPEMLSTSTTEFGLAPNGDYRPLKTYSLETDRPVPLSTIGAFDPNQLVRNSNYIKQQSEFYYDAYGNQICAKDVKGDRSSFTLYGYSVLIPVASIDKSSINEIAFTSFESNDNSGNSFQWNWTSSPTTITDKGSPTGERYTNGSVFTDIISYKNKPYILSFWAKGNSFTVTSLILLTQKISGPDINGWKYYEYEVAPTNSYYTISVNGNGSGIDELRLYPKGATMTTTTYNLDFGKTSECDINNRIVYYEYDWLGRISKVLDDHHNIIKTYEYHFKN